jgi:hypothetical protein
VEVEGDHPKDPREYDAIEAQPRRSLDHGRGIDEDVVIEGVATKGEVNHVPSAGIGGRLWVKDNQDE